MKDLELNEVDARLQSEARAIKARDGFSRLLHERCMEALRREGLKGAAVTPPRRWTLGRAAAAAGVAAAVVVAAWLALRTAETPVTPGPIAVTGGGPTQPAIGPGIDTHVAESTTGLLDERKYAYLDRDARKLLIFVADQFPEFPSESGAKAPGNGEPPPK